MSITPISKAQWLAIGKGALIAGAGAGLTYLVSIAGSLPLGVWAPIVTAGLSVLVNVVRKLGTDDTQPAPATPARV